MAVEIKKAPPWRPRVISPSEAATREWIAGRFPGGAAGVFLRSLEKNPRVGRHRIFLNGISKGPSLDSSPSVFAAIASDASLRSQRAVLCVPLELAHRIIDTVLGRKPRRFGEALTSGEEGVLIYILDKIGGDWTEAGGPSFVLRGLLSDGDQIADYLGGAPKWHAFGKIEGEELDAQFSLWFSDPGAGSARTLTASDIAYRASSWPVVLAISTGWSRLDTDELERLDAGDLICLDAGSHPEIANPDSYLTLSCGRWSRQCRWLDRRRFEIVSDASSEVQMETKVKGEKEVPVKLNNSVGRDTGSMEVIVRVEVGEVRMTVEKAASLVPGRVLRLDRDVGSEVNLKVGEKLMGRGELVEHEGALAVEVLEVS